MHHLAPLPPIQETGTERDVLDYLPPDIRDTVARLPASAWERLEEIRLRVGRPLVVTLREGERFVSREGIPGVGPSRGYLVTVGDIKRMLQIITASSLYALEDELRNGFITLPGVYRVGLAGKVITEGGRIRTIKHIAGLNLRIAREVRGAADAILPKVTAKPDRVYHTLIASPPRCGKTTLLRDLARQMSNGIPHLGFAGVPVVIVDERSEIAGCYQGTPQLDVGLRTDVLDKCPKAEGMMLALRALSPVVVITDEIGREEDAHALEEVLNAGVKVIATAHASSLEDLVRRPAFAYLFRLRLFERVVFLSRRCGPGTVDQIIDGRRLDISGG
ncbi:MAG: stage III sporulation protein AA [Desulfotomaculales bacterium]